MGRPRPYGGCLKVGGRARVTETRVAFSFQGRSCVSGTGLVLSFRRRGFFEWRLRLRGGTSCFQTPASCRPLPVAPQTSPRSGRLAASLPSLQGRGGSSSRRRAHSAGTVGCAMRSALSSVLRSIVSALHVPELPGTE